MREAKRAAGRARRCVGRVVVCGLLGAGWLPAQETNPAGDNAPPPASSPVPNWASVPFVTNNPAASSTFLQRNYGANPAPTPTPAPPPPNQNLSLRAPGTAEPAEALAPSSPAAPRPFRFLNPAGQPEALAAHLLIVYNQNDPEAKELALYYATKREIEPDHILAISCPTTEEITREQFEETIREPIISYLSQKNWMMRHSEQVRVGKRMLELLIANTNDIWAMVLIRGVPLKIAPDPGDVDSMEPQPSLQTNAAAVDSELAMLPIFGLPHGGYVPNPFFDNDANGVNRVGPELATKIILVTRLDAPTAGHVRRMIDDTLEAEKNRLAGAAVVDSRGHTDVRDGYTIGDNWLRRSRELLEQDGWSVKFDDQEATIPATDPLNHVALYLGWYAGDASGPWVTPPGRFVPGAIAYHLHSFSGSTLRSPTSNWIGPFIAHGAAATMGTVYEPYLILTPRLDVFTKRLLDGDSFAEAAYASQRGLSWMGTVVGDPLYRPFRKPLDVALADAEHVHPQLFDWLLLQKVKRQIASGQLLLNAGALKQALALPDAGAVAAEGLGDMIQKISQPDAEVAYKKAMSFKSEPIDRIRIGLKLAQFYSTYGQDDLAQAQLKMLSELYPQEAPRFGISGQMIPTANPPGGAPSEPPLEPMTPSKPTTP